MLVEQFRVGIGKTVAAGLIARRLCLEARLPHLVVVDEAHSYAPLRRLAATTEDARALAAAFPRVKLGEVPPSQHKAADARATKRGVGFISDPKKRKAIELHAEDMAVAHYQAQGWTVERYAV
ncbi:hypothetical protein [Streptomyces coffeae]|uniref:hypothetical protein n=1 Tax=Streptomyces coffeae TaxID=621382 RepID=UPI001F37D19B|nr:hypothetical protein [Streptomyces coffeae]